MFIRDHSKALYEPQTVYNGLAQGSILNPTLLNFNSTELHDVFDAELKIIHIITSVIILMMNAC